MNKVLKKALAVTGPTATGKTAFAVELARRFGGEIISVDSRQVYQYLNIGSGKDLSEYGEIPYHLIDIADPAKEIYNLARFLPDAYRAAEAIIERGKLPIFCGGTALYLDALLRDYRLPGGALPPRCSGVKRTRQEGTQMSFEPPFELNFLVLGVFYPRETVRKRIEERLDKRLAGGMIEEVCNLLARHGMDYSQLEFLGLEYREIARFLQGECQEKEMRSDLLAKIRQFAKRQDIFFRKIEREGINIHWLPEVKRSEKATELIEDFLLDRALPEPEIQLKNIYYGKKSESDD